MKILVTSGPTREYIDAVRYISNASTGKMGYALARVARRCGHQVTLVSGPVALRVPRQVEFIPVISAREMLDAVLAEFPKVDAVIMNAAVADYRPKLRRKRKMKKSAAQWELEMVPNPDILKTLDRHKRHQRLIGFALETHRGLQHARQKLEEKNLDWIVLNSAETIGADHIDATLLSREGPPLPFKRLTKEQLALRLIRVLES